MPHSDQCCTSQLTSHVGRMISNSDSLRFDDPKGRLNPFRSQCADRAVEALQHSLDGLIAWSQHDDAGRAPRIVATRVREIGVERDENPSLAFAGVIVLRPRDQSIQAVLQCLNGAIRALATERIEATLWIVEPERLRIRDHPTDA